MDERQHHSVLAQALVGVIETHAEMITLLAHLRQIGDAEREAAVAAMRSRFLNRLRMYWSMLVFELEAEGLDMYAVLAEQLDTELLDAAFETIGDGEVPSRGLRLVSNIKTS